MKTALPPNQRIIWGLVMGGIATAAVWYENNVVPEEAKSGVTILGTPTRRSMKIKEREQTQDLSGELK